jgi:hypothetical protein
MAERSAIASGFSLSEIGTGGGSGLKTGGFAGGGGDRYICWEVGLVGEGDRGGGTIVAFCAATGSSWANTGVTGE